MTSVSSPAPGVAVLGALHAGFSSVLTSEALGFLAALHRKFEAERRALLADRALRQSELDRGVMLHFLPETAAVRAGSWSGPPIPADLLDRRVELTGPVSRKLLINALNSGANCFMGDFEDSTSPTWFSVIDGQINCRDAVRRTITLTAPGGKQYRLNEKTATLLVRPRGWHLIEAHIVVDGEPMSASLVDYGLFLFWNAAELLSRGSGPYFYLPKMESHKEARLWNEVFVYSQERLRIPRGTIRATCLIETLPAAFEMDEILYELREHSAGLNCGRWDYIFSLIKKMRAHPSFVLPDRSLVTMQTPFMAAYVRLLIRTCHRRGVHAMGGMAAQIPINNDSAANATAFERVRADKEREVRLGHDGTWVAHPALIPLARAVFDQHMPSANQIHAPQHDTQPITAAHLLSVPPSPRVTLAGVLSNVSVVLSYLSPWLCGVGCVPISHLMEDAATAEISRCQLWQWRTHAVPLATDSTRTGRAVVDAALITACIDEVAARKKSSMSEEAWRDGRWETACALLSRLALSAQLDDFLTSLAYPSITTNIGSAQHGAASGASASSSGSNSSSRSRL